MAPFDGHDRAGRVLHGGDGVDELRPAPPGREVPEDLIEVVDADAVAVQAHAVHLCAPLGQPAQRPGIGGLLHHDRVAGRQHRGVDEVERLQRSRGDQDLRRVRRHLGPPVERGRDELSQGQMALGAAPEVVTGQGRPVAGQRDRGGLGEPAEGHAGRIVVAADEIERRIAAPAGLTVGEIPPEQGRHVEAHGGTLGASANGCKPPRAEAPSTPRPGRNRRARRSGGWPAELPRPHPPSAARPRSRSTCPVRRSG